MAADKDAVFSAFYGAVFHGKLGYLNGEAHDAVDKGQICAAVQMAVLKIACGLAAHDYALAGHIEAAVFKFVVAAEIGVSAVAAFGGVHVAVVGLQIDKAHGGVCGEGRPAVAEDGAAVKIAVGVVYSAVGAAVALYAERGGRAVICAAAAGGVLAVGRAVGY